MVNINFANALQSMDQKFGLMDIVLPFILIFTIIYAVSSMVLHFEDKGNKLKVVLSLVLSAITVIPHVTGRYQQFDVIDIINQSIPQVMMVIVGVVLALILIGATGFDMKKKNPFGSWTVWTALGIVALIFADNVNFWNYSNIPILNWLTDPDVQAIAIILIVFGLIVKYVTGGDSENVTKARLEDLLLSARKANDTERVKDLEARIAAYK